MQKNNDIPWWKRAVFYQIYPRSYQDTSGNGIGDLKGIEQRLSYIKSLGVDGIWISPFFKSPQKDYGYDVSDYLSVDPMFGSNDDFRRLLDKAHDLDLKIIADLVLSHTSDKHDWFQESRQSKDNGKADWYVWADAKPDGSPPNNWQSVFGGPAWTFDTKRAQYYLHNFLKEQPDLNYNNPKVEKQAYDILRYWLDFGVDGFRLDALHFCFCDPELRDNPPKKIKKSDTQFEGEDTYSMQDHIYDCNRPEMQPFIKKIQSTVDEYNDRMIVAEVADIHTSIEYCNAPDKLNTAYNFELTKGSPKTFNASLFKNTLAITEADQNFWPSWAFCNHDMIRVVTRWGGEEHQHNSNFAKMLQAILVSLRGTPYIYEGEELGLSDVKIPFEFIQDPWGKFLWPEWQGRDGCRTPMPWEQDKKNAGFSEADETWLPIPDDHKERAVDVQENQPDSVLNFFRQLLQWRKSQGDLQIGDIEFFDHGEDILVYRRGDIMCIFNLRFKKDEITLNNLEEMSNAPLNNCSLSDNIVSLDPFGFGFFNIKK